MAEALPSVPCGKVPRVMSSEAGPEAAVDDPGTEPDSGMLLRNLNYVAIILVYVVNDRVSPIW